MIIIIAFLLSPISRLVLRHRDTLEGHQDSRRGGTVRVSVGRGDKSGRVTLKGKAVTVSRGLFRRWGMTRECAMKYIAFGIPFR